MIVPMEVAYPDEPLRGVAGLALGRAPTPGALEGHRSGTERVECAIVGFDRDDVGDWVALLECGHRQHVRHRPPWQERPWVLTPEGREGRLGTSLQCVLCDEEDEVEEGGEAACLAPMVCAECGAVIGDGGAHRAGCTAASSAD